MSLINRETGETAFEDKQLNAVNKQLIEQIEKLKRDNASKNMLIAQLKKESAEAAEECEEAEKELAAVEQELAKQKEQAKEYEKKYHKELWKPKEKTYYPRCQKCRQYELDQRELKLDRMMKEPEAVIQERVDKLTAKYEREGNLRDFIKSLLRNDAVFFFPMIYFVVEFIITIIKHAPLRMDTINAGKWIWGCITFLFFKVRDIIIAAGGITSGLSNETAQAVLRWIIMIILALVAIAATVFIGWQIVRFKIFLFDRREDFYGYPFIVFKLILLSLCVHLGKYQTNIGDEYHLNIWGIYIFFSVITVAGILFYYFMDAIYPNR
ncbi:hypothetical protein [Ruminococcus sp.]|uniref:hypothetical protein n=1 Tax=Ruminococcus sp. TaxID=41978 RepID=UPI0025DF0F47|nr:hypothetical protein [Ruminococcus sp.]MBR1432521.1 hypothetical protein [Ruminococcus sp.]